MKIKTKILVGFLKKARMSGTQSLIEGILRFEKDGLKIFANSQSVQARVMAWLYSTAFEEYEAIGNVGLNDMQNVVKVIERFGETISLKKEGNLLTIKGEGKTVEVELINENFLQTDTAEPNLTFADNFEIKSEKLHDIIKDVLMNKDTVINIKTADKSVLFTNTGKYKFTNTLESPTCKGGVSVKFGQPFIDCVDELDGVLQFSVGNDYPCKITERLEKSVITIIVAPRIESEEE
jgi:hypothetical protein